jgi:hypothetical protein
MAKTHCKVTFETRSRDAKQWGPKAHLWDSRGNRLETIRFASKLTAEMRKEAQRDLLKLCGYSRKAPTACKKRWCR